MDDKQIKRLFAKLDKAEKQREAIRDQLYNARADYAKRHGLLALPRVEAMRQAVGA